MRHALRLRSVRRGHARGGHAELRARAAPAAWRGPAGGGSGRWLNRRAQPADWFERRKSAAFFGPHRSLQAALGVGSSGTQKGDSVESQAPGGRASAESQALGEPLVGCQAVMPLLTCGAERHRRPEAAAGGPCGTRVPSRGRLAPDEGACMSHALARCIRANVCVRWSRCAMHVHAVSKVDACRCVPSARTRVHACKRPNQAWCMCSS